MLATLINAQSHVVSQAEHGLCDKTRKGHSAFLAQTRKGRLESEESSEPVGSDVSRVVSDTTVFVDELASQTTGVSLIAEVRLVDGSGLVAPPMEVRATPFIMGRGTDASLCVADDQVSRHHCQIEQDGGNYIIRDLGSTNGTFLNGVRVLICRLHPGDQLQIGSSQILFSLGYRFGGQ